MASIEAQLLQAAKTKLLAASTAAGTNVFVARDEPVEGAHELPAIVIHAPRSTATPLGKPYYKHRVSIQLIVQCMGARSSSTAASAEETAELAAHALENQALAALLAHPQVWFASIETIEGYTSESLAPQLADYVYRARQAVITIRCVADFELALPETLLELIHTTYTYGDAEDAPTVIAETETEE